MELPSPAPDPAGRRWIDRLDPDQLRRIRALLPLDSRWTAVPVAWIGGCAVLLGILVTQDLGPWRWPACALAGFLLHTLGVFMHEGAHGLLFRRPALDRATGFLCGAFLLTSHSAYRCVHVLHHRHVGTDRDPDDFFSPGRPGILNSVIFWIWPLIAMPVYVLHVAVSAFRLGSRRDRIDCALEYLGILAMALGAATWARAGGRGAALLETCLASWFVAGLVSALRGWAEHVATDPASPWTSSRTTGLSRPISFALAHVNYHLDHHLFPGVPWYRLPELHAVLEPTERRVGSFLCPSYLRHVLDVLRHGPRRRSGGSE